MLVSRSQLAAILGTNPGTISKWQGDGLPIAVHGGRGVESKFDTAAVVGWMVARERAKFGAAPTVSLENERARLARAQSEKAELELQARRAELLPVSDIERVWSVIVHAIRERALAQPRALAARLVQEASIGGASAVEAVLREYVTEMLAELASWKPPAKSEATA